MNKLFLTFILLPQLFAFPPVKASFRAGDKRLPFFLTRGINPAAQAFSLNARRGGPYNGKACSCAASAFPSLRP